MTNKLLHGEGKGQAHSSISKGALAKTAVGVFAAAAVAGGYLLFDSNSKKPVQEASQPDVGQVSAKTDPTAKFLIQRAIAQEQAEKKIISTNPECSEVSSGYYSGLAGALPTRVGGYLFSFEPPTREDSARLDISYSSTGDLAFANLQAPLFYNTVAADSACGRDIKLTVSAITGSYDINGNPVRLELPATSRGNGLYVPTYLVEISVEMR